MLPLSAERLLEAWERGIGLDSAGRARVLLAAGAPSVTEAELGGQTAGRRDADLLSIRAATFGPQVDALASCPACGQLVEFRFSATEVVSVDAEDDGGEPLRVRENGFDVRFRLPTVADLAEVSIDGADAHGVRTALLERCVVQARRRGRAVAAEDLSEEVTDAIDSEMARADPGANLTFTLACEACGTAWSAPLDVPAFVWAEVDSWARRLLVEVHSLASLYGWTEREILALSPARRRTYLELAASSEPAR
jgi:hypothetical protein